MTDFRSGFFAIIGRPNVGKSTLVNVLLGQKIAAVSPKPQTTRKRQLGILTTDTAQLVFVDTPGMHNPRHKLGTFLNQEAEEALELNYRVHELDAAQLRVAELAAVPVVEDQHVHAARFEVLAVVHGEHRSLRGGMRCQNRQQQQQTAGNRCGVIAHGGVPREGRSGRTDVDVAVTTNLRIDEFLRGQFVNSSIRRLL